MHFIGIDIGTTTICGVMLNIESRKIVSVTKENNSIIPSKSGWERLQDPGQILGIVREILTELLKISPDVRGIGVTGQMHGILYLDQDGHAISPLFNWQDGRGNLIYQDQQSYASFLTENTGYPVASGFGLVTQFYNSLHNLAPAGRAKLGTIMDFIVMQLTGRKSPVMDYTNAAGLGFFDLRKLQFDVAALKNVSITPDILPDIVPSGTLAGYYQNSIPVYTALGDNQASFLGSVREIDRSILVTIGTSSQLSVYSNPYQNIPPLDTRPFPGGGYLLVGAALCGGKSLNILETFFRETVALFYPASPLKQHDFYQKIASLDYDSLCERDLPKVATLFNGTRLDSGKRGQISNLSMDNFTPENLIAGFLYGIADELSGFYRLVPPSLKRHQKSLIASGNAIRFNKLLDRILEEQFQCPLHIPAYQEEAALGAGLTSVVGGGYVDNFLEVGKLIETHAV